MKSRLLKISIVSLFLVSCLYLPVKAYMEFLYGMNTPNFTVKNFNMTGTWESWWWASSKAIIAWNNTPTRASITVSSTSPNSLIIGSYTDSFLGQYSADKVYPTGKAYQFSIRINSYNINTSPDLINLDNYIQSVVCHELGHAFSLADLPGASNCIMGYERNRNTMIAPQTDDINGVNAYYPNY